MMIQDVIDKISVFAHAFALSLLSLNWVDFAEQCFQFIVLLALTVANFLWPFALLALAFFGPPYFMYKAFNDRSIPKRSKAQTKRIEEATLAWFRRDKP